MDRALRGLIFVGNLTANNTRLVVVQKLTQSHKHLDELGSADGVLNVQCPFGWQRHQINTIDGGDSRSG